MANLRPWSFFIRHRPPPTSFDGWSMIVITNPKAPPGSKESKSFNFDYSYWSHDVSNDTCLQNVAKEIVPWVSADLIESVPREQKKTIWNHDPSWLVSILILLFSLYLTCSLKMPTLLHRRTYTKILEKKCSTTPSKVSFSFSPFVSFRPYDKRL